MPRIVGSSPSGQMSFDTRNLPDGSRQRTAAEIVDRFFGHRHDYVVTKKDLNKVRKALASLDGGQPAQHAGLHAPTAKGPLAQLTQFERQVLRDHVDELEQFLAPPQATDVDFCTSLATQAILNDDIRRCAEFIAKNFGEGEAEVNLSELTEAIAALAAAKANGGALTDRLENAEGARSFTQENVDRLEAFMKTGLGGLVTHDHVSINGVRFKAAYPLPAEPNADAIKQFEERFKDTGFDRIYIKGNDGRLYVVLNESGSLRIRAGMRVQLGPEGSRRDSGQVLFVHDVNNSIREATIGFWGGLASRLVRSMQGKLNEDLDSQVNKVATDAAAGGASESTEAADKSIVPYLAVGGVLAGGGAIGAAALFNPAVLAAIGGGAVLAITGFNVFDAIHAKRSQDLSMIYHAMGVTVNRSENIKV